MALHLFKHRGIKDIIRTYVSGTRCPVSLKQFWQREVLLNHVRRGRTPCKRQVMLRGPVLSLSQGDELDLELRSFTSASIVAVFADMLLKHHAYAFMDQRCVSSLGLCVCVVFNWEVPLRCSPCFLHGALPCLYSFCV